MLDLLESPTMVYQGSRFKPMIYTEIILKILYVHDHYIVVVTLTKYQILQPTLQMSMSGDPKN